MTMSGFHVWSYERQAIPVLFSMGRSDVRQKFNACNNLIRARSTTFTKMVNQKRKLFEQTTIDEPSQTDTLYGRYGPTCLISNMTVI